MKTLPRDLAEHLASGVTTLAWCWKLVRRDGVVMGFTDHDRDLSFDGVRFAAGSGLTGSELDATLGLAPGNMDVEGALLSGAIDEEAIRRGLLDGATAEVWLVNWQAVDQRVLMQAGRIGEITRSAHGFRAELRGPLAQLDQLRGRLFQPGCDAVLGDARCGVDLARFTVSAVVRAAAQARLTLDGLGGFAEGWFSEGTLVWLSGANAGARQRVRAHGAGVITLWEAPAAAVVAADRVTLAAGCDKRFSTCAAKFSNGINFRGFPHMPGNDFLASPV